MIFNKKNKYSNDELFKLVTEARETLSKLYKTEKITKELLQTNNLPYIEIKANKRFIKNSSKLIKLAQKRGITLDDTTVEVTPEDVINSLEIQAKERINGILLVSYMYSNYRVNEDLAEPEVEVFITGKGVDLTVAEIRNKYDNIISKYKEQTKSNTLAKK